ncbi:hypothetical protein [Vallitalea okinawensis]|uniref:hypothetical protein n=1 Tax=Vallitalea okinawensis TaxID=2078660 RepID=UPI000CFBF3F3|nr:hypothetical protein [Vallitalea okinawensis]
MKDICCIIDECLDKAYLYLCGPCPDQCYPPRCPCPPKNDPYCDPCCNRQPYDQPHHNQFFKYW